MVTSGLLKEMRINFIVLQHSKPTSIQACKWERLSLARKSVAQIMEHTTISKDYKQVQTLDCKYYLTCTVM